MDRGILQLKTEFCKLQVLFLLNVYSFSIFGCKGHNPSDFDTAVSKGMLQSMRLQRVEHD